MSRLWNAPAVALALGRTIEACRSPAGRVRVNLANVAIGFILVFVVLIYVKLP